MPDQVRDPSSDDNKLATNPRAGQRFFYGWVVLAVSSVSLALAAGTWYSFTVFFVALVDEFHWARADTALAFSLFAVSQGFTMAMVATFLDRFGARRVMAVGSVLFAASLAATSQATELWYLYLTFGILAGISSNAISFVTNYGTLNRWFVKRRGLAFGIATAGMGVGMATIVPLNGYLISSIGWRPAYLVNAGLIVAIMPALAILFFRDRPEDMGLLPDGIRSGEATPLGLPQTGASNELGFEERAVKDRRWAATDWTLGRALRTWRFWGLFVTFFGAPVATQSVMIHQAAYLVGVGYPAMLVAWIVGLLGLISVPAKILWGWVSDRFGRELTYSLGTATLLLSLATLIATPALLGLWPLLVYAVFFGVGYAANAPMTPTVTSDLFSGRRYAIIYGVLSIGTNTGGALGPWIAGRVYDVSGAYTVAFLIAAGTAVGTSAALWLVAPRRVRPVGRALQKARAVAGSAR